MAVTTTHFLPPFWEGPFGHPDISPVGFRYLNLSDAGQFSLVSKAWNEAMGTPSIWLTLSAKKKIPHIEGRISTAKKDLRYMLSHTISARQMACFGKFVGEAPTISATAFDMFKTAMDRYEPSKKLSNTFVFVVEPLAIYRDYDEALFKELIANGDFDATAPENENPKEDGLWIPYSLKNLKILAEHPLFKKGEGPVFRNAFPEILKQCSRISKAVKVTLMRKRVPEESRNLTYSDQKNRLKEKGHVIVSLCTRGYYDLLEILNKDSCPDLEKPRWTFSRTCDEIVVDNKENPVTIGGFAPRGGFARRGGFAPRTAAGTSGIYIASYYNPATAGTGAVPVFPEEVLAIEH